MWGAQQVQQWANRQVPSVKKQPPYWVHSEPCLVMSLRIITEDHGDGEDGYLVSIYPRICM